MMNASPDDPDDKPLDPEMEKVRRKMVRLLGISIGIMFIGLMAVLGAIVYKFTRPAETGVASSSFAPADAPDESQLLLPAGFAVEQVALDGNRIAFYGRGEGGDLRILILDVESGRIVGNHAIGQRR